jgi:hypothetical protein
MKISESGRVGDLVVAILGIGVVERGLRGRVSWVMRLWAEEERAYRCSEVDWMREMFLLVD